MTRLLFICLTLLGLATSAMAQHHHRRNDLGPYQRGGDIVGATPGQYGGGYTQQYVQPQYVQPQVIYPQQDYYGGNGYFDGGTYYRPKRHHHGGGGELAAGAIIGLATGLIINEVTRPQRQATPVYQAPPPPSPDGIRWVQPGDGNFRQVSPKSVKSYFRCNWKENMVFSPYGTGEKVRAPRVCLSPTTGYVLAYRTPDGSWFAGTPES